MARREYSEEVRAAVLAALLTGQSISSVAREYRIPKGTVYRWAEKVAKIRNGMFTKDATQKKERIGQLLIEYLTESLVTLRAQVEFFRNEEWLKEQSAADIAVLHGVTTDKTIRLLEALAGDEADTD